MRHSAKKTNSYPADIECIISPKNGKGGIYIGNLEASESARILKRYDIKAILTAAKEIQLKHPKSLIPYQLYIPGEDHERFDLLKYFEESNKFIANSLKQTNILVHCMAGISRSVTLVIAYLMKNYEMSYQQAYETVKSRRKIINPNRGFIRQLEEYERKLKRKTQHNNRVSFDDADGRRHSPQRYSYLGQSLYNRNNRQAPYRFLTRGSESRLKGFVAEKSYNNSIDFQRQPLVYISRNRQNYNEKYRISRDSVTFTNYSSYAEMNKQLDEKIAKIRKKYKEATEVLNRGERSRRNEDSSTHMRPLDKTEPVPQHQANELPLPLEFSRNYSTMQDHSRKMRTNSINPFLSPKMQKTLTYGYY